VNGICYSPALLSGANHQRRHLSSRVWPAGAQYNALQDENGTPKENPGEGLLMP
jgi:hypothetical protein